MTRPLRFADIVPFDISSVADDADRLGPDVLRMENLDTDIAPSPAALAATRAAIGDLSASSYLPFTGRRDLRLAISDDLATRSGHRFDPDTEVVISSGGLAAILAALLATTDAGDRVVVTDPCYAGFIGRIRLVGAEPVHVPLRTENGRWRLDLDAMASITQARAVLFMSPSMPTGHVLTDEEWEAVAALLDRTGAWLLYDTAMERILFDQAAVNSPLTRPELRDRTVILGSAAKEHRLIGWRVGWAAGPAEVIADIAQAVIYNTVVPSGFAQIGVLTALRDAEPGITAATAELQRRRDLVLSELAGYPPGYPAICPDGGWSLLVDTRALGTESRELSRALLEHGHVAATPMTAWGPVVAPRYLRLVFATEPVQRLVGLRARFDRALLNLDRAG